ncbi:MAG: hypothetical protein JW902_10055 [Syntrophaceae bacterium]|nr:hypothetical protein [Syntrophaceae bacterium]
MSRDKAVASCAVHTINDIVGPVPGLKECVDRMGILSYGRMRSEGLPFSIHDTTAGNETELQAVVEGTKDDVDLPNLIEQSNYYSNILRRAASGDLPGKAVSALERFINENSDNVWENSWVRLPVASMGCFARQTMDADLLADKSDPSQGTRSDVDRFIIRHRNHDCVRVPVSYLLKLALADVIDSENPISPVILQTGERLMNHFLCDNTSPETFSLYVSSHTDGPGPGREVAKETAKRFLLTQLLVMYANEKFGLSQMGQRVRVFFSPHPPCRQKKLNDCISDAFYRELFMNPCLSGWNRGESKYEYMHLCHQVLSRSQMNALAKLREAGIITNNLVVLPNTSNISLANNGIHVSLGSRKLSALMADESSGYARRHEKYVGDLAVKILEHFVPLFVGTYSGSPYRIDFPDFHAERALGFLAHELDFTHLRMLWRRWKKKAKLSLFGRPITPFGPPWLDSAISRFLGLKGDYLPDYRLIDYLVALMSTEKSPGSNGELFNHDHLKQDLHDLGVFDKRMSLYSFIKLREFDNMRFSGFESRYYSLFPSFEEDMAKAVDFQNLIHALTFKYMAAGAVTHSHIPDDPFIESERRQITFGCAIGLPTFFVRRDTDNVFLKRILSKTRRIRPSNRYPGYLRVYHQEYCRALLEIIWEDGADLVEILGMKETLNDLIARIENPEEHSASGRLTGRILNRRRLHSPLALSGDEFNREIENLYRHELRQEHIQEGWRFFEHDVWLLERRADSETRSLGKTLRLLAGCHDIPGFMESSYHEMILEKISVTNLKRLIHLLLLTIHADTLKTRQPVLVEPVAAISQAI